MIEDRISQETMRSQVKTKVEKFLALPDVQRKIKLDESDIEIIKETMNSIPGPVLALLIPPKGTYNSWKDPDIGEGECLAHDLLLIGQGFWSYEDGSSAIVIASDMNQIAPLLRGSGQDNKILREVAPSTSLKLNALGRGGTLTELKDGSWVVVVSK